MTVFDMFMFGSAMVFDSDYRPYFVRLALFSCRVLVHISYRPWPSG